MCGGTVVDRQIDCIEKEILRKKENPSGTDVRKKVLRFSNEIFCREVVELYKK